MEMEISLTREGPRSRGLVPNLAPSFMSPRRFGLSHILTRDPEWQIPNTRVPQLPRNRQELPWHAVDTSSQTSSEYLATDLT